MNVDLKSSIEQLHQVLVAGKQTSEASVIGAVLSYEDGSDEFWKKLASLDIWGGAGSVFDQAFATMGDLPKDEYKRLTLQFLKLLLPIGEEVITAGRSTPFVQRAVKLLPELRSDFAKRAP